MKIDIQGKTMNGETFLKENEDLRQPCEIWTRVMGYHRPISTFNPGKKSEHAERVSFEETRIKPLTM